MWGMTGLRLGEDELALASGQAQRKNLAELGFNPARLVTIELFHSFMQPITPAGGVRAAACL